MDDHYEVKEVFDRHSGTVTRLYSYKRKPCRRVVLTSRLAEQLAGYSLIEKDLRSGIAWLTAIDGLHTEGPTRPNEHFARGTDREKYTIIKGLFVAGLTFYGKCFSKCDGRPVKLERTQLDEKFREAHDTAMRYRHNFAAYSGAEKLESVEVALVLPLKAKTNAMPKLYRELFQPDLLSSSAGEVSFKDLFEHAHAIATAKMERLSVKILNEEVLPKGRAHWLGR